MLTPEEIEDIWNTADCARNDERFQSDNVFNLINHIQAVEEKNKTLLEGMEEIAFGRVEGDYSDVRRYAIEIIESTQK